MPTAEDLAQLKTLLNQLLPIAQTHTGELIRAEDWNTLVSATMALARSLLERDENRQMPQHTHLDQVTAEWLAPALRDQLQSGPLADPAMQARLLTIEQQLRALLKQVDGQREDLTGVRGRLVEVATRDIVRESAVTDLTRKVGGLGDARTDVLDLRKSIGVIRNDMGTVLDAARRLEVGGQTVDLGALVGRVGVLEGFRQGFTAANGQVFDAAAIEQRLAENRNQFVLHAELDDALRTRTGQVSPEVLAGVEERLGTNLRAQVSSSLETFGSQIRNETRASLTGVGDLIATRLNDALPGVSQTAANALTPLIDRARQDAIAAAVRQAAEQTTARENAVRADMDRLGTDLRASFATAVTAQLTQVLSVQLSGIRSDVAALGAKTDVLSGRTGSIEATIGRQGDVVASLQQDAGRQRLELRDLLQSEVKLATDAISRDLTAGIQSVQTDLKTQFEVLAKNVRQSAIDAGKTAAVEAAQTESRNLRTQILAEMHQVAKEEAGTLIRDQIQVNTGNIGLATGGGRIGTGVLINR